MKHIYIPFIGIIIAEIMMYSNNVYYGLGIHTINLLTIIFIMSFSSIDIRIKNVLQSFVLLTLLRLINLSVPQFFNITLLQYSLIYGIMFIPIYSIIKSQNLSKEELGINFHKMYIYLPLAILIGSIISIIEYKIFNPISLIENIRFSSVFLLILIMFAFVATVEEIIFRSILQSNVVKVFGIRYGILASSILFGVMHSSYGIFNEILIAIILGIILGYIFQKTKSLLFIISIHGATNVLLFGILQGFL